MLKTMRFLTPAAALGGAMTAGNAFAGQGLPKPWQMWFQEPASPVMERIDEFHDLVFAIEVAIVLLVLGIMAYIVVRFNHKANPVPSKNTHNTLLEVIWTVIPIIILVVIAVPSFKLLYFADKIEKADMTLKVTGNQWFWSYAYPDQGDIQFDSIIVAAEDLTAQGFGSLRARPPDDQAVNAQGVYRTGTYRVVLRRALRGSGERAVALQPGTMVPVGFAVWNGSAGDRDGKKSVTIWQELWLEP